MLPQMLSASDSMMAWSRVSGSDYLQRARAIAPVISAAADDIERKRRLTSPVLQALVQAGFYRMLQPRFLQGAELPLLEFAEVIEEVAKTDASTAWCLAQCSACAMAAAYLDRSTAVEVFGPPSGIVAWGPPAPSVARTVEGGYRVTGSWQFASGGHQASWIGGQSYVYNTEGELCRKANGAPVIRMMLFPSSQVQISDVWDVVGLNGTGSNSYSVNDVFVPERFSFGRDEEDDRRETGPLFRFSTSNVYSFGFAAVALGIARKMLDDAINFAAEKTPSGSKRAMRDNNVVQAQIGRSEATWRSARSYLHDTARNVWDGVCQGSALSLEQKIEIRLSATFAIHQCAGVVDTVYQMMGATSIFKQNPFERRFRDMHTVAQQIQGRQSHYENVGQVLLGLEPDAALFST
jgi:alkylation response protein AidB-like acyl-CoA dehydrogenase